MKIQDYSNINPVPLTPSEPKHHTILEATTATLIFLIPALLMFILAAN